MEATNIQLSAQMRGLSKSEFLKNEATPAVKTTALISMIIFAVIAVLIIAATVNTNSISVLDMPVVSALVDADERKEMKSELKAEAKLLNDADDLLDKIKDEYGSKSAKAAKDLIKKTKAASKTLSLNNVVAMMDAREKLEKVADDEVVDYMGVDDVAETFEEASPVFKVAQIATYVFAAIVILLAFFAAYNKNTALSIGCIFLYVPACALLSSTVLALVIGVALIALAVTTSKVNKAWKAVQYTA